MQSVSIYEAGGVLHASRLPNGWKLEHAPDHNCSFVTNGETIYTLFAGYGGAERVNVVIMKQAPWEEMKIANKASIPVTDAGPGEWFSKILSHEIGGTGETLRLKCGEKACDQLQELVDSGPLLPRSNDDVDEDGPVLLIYTPESKGLEDANSIDLKFCPFCGVNVENKPDEFFDE